MPLMCNTYVRLSTLKIQNTSYSVQLRTMIGLGNATTIDMSFINLLDRSAQILFGLLGRSPPQIGDTELGRREYRGLSARQRLGKFVSVSQTVWRAIDIGEDVVEKETQIDSAEARFYCIKSTQMDGRLLATPKLDISLGFTCQFVNSEGPTSRMTQTRFKILRLSCSEVINYSIVCQWILQ